MKVWYRPKRSNRAEEMSEAQRFDSIDKMRIWVYSEWNADGKVFDFQDVEVDFTQEIPDEVETGWHHVHFVTIKRFGDEQFDKPQIIGYCSFCLEEVDALGFHYQEGISVKYGDLSPNKMRQMLGMTPFDFDSMINKPLQGVNDAITKWLTSIEIKPDDK